VTAPLNGTHLGSAPPEEPRVSVARAVYEANAEDGDAPWPELDDEERQSLTDWAEAYLSAHIGWLETHGFRLLPPGAVPRPQSEAEAMAMLKASKGWFDAQKRKPGLVGAVAPKLILPPGTKLQ